MPIFISLRLLGLFIAFVFSKSAYGSSLTTRTQYAVKDSHLVPRQWRNLGRAPAQHLLHMQISLKQGNFDELERHLYEVSTPSHARYGKQLSAAEVNRLIRPSKNTLSEWRIGFADVESRKYSVFEHEDGSLLVRAPEWSLPMHLHKHINTVQPTNSFLRSMAKRSALRVVPGPHGMDFVMPSSFAGNNKASVAQACNITAVTPSCLRTLYGTANYTVQSASKNSIGVTNFGGETANRSDINIFLANFRKEAAAASSSFKVQTVNGGVDTQIQLTTAQLNAGLGIEGNLDAETVLGISYPTPMIVYNTAGSPPFIADAFTPTNSNEPFLDWVQFMLSNQTSLPNVISISYGDDEQTVPPAYAKAVCDGFAQMGARGVTVLVASGDDGVGPQGLCFTNDGKNTIQFLPEFPASCPYVTVVGGTKNVNPEIVAANADGSFASGGGFSNYFTRPTYQDTVVPAYVKSMGNTFQGMYNISGRGYPDIATQAFQYLVIWNGTLNAVSGTSAATPTAASIISLVNDAMIAAGKPVMGFMNPWLYSTGFKAFTDVTSGSALGCNTTGFPAQTGWDAVTGFGTPNFSAFRAGALNGSAV